MKKGHGLLHGLLMLICCLVPMLLLVMFISSRASGGSSGFGWVFFLLCPLMHILMMKFMMGGHKNHNEGNAKERETQEEI